jgi:hypothetical protein
MSKFGYMTNVEQSFRNNKGIFSLDEILELDQENKWTNFGQLELIETQNASSVSSLDFNNLGNFNVHLITLNNIKSSVDNGRPILRYYENGVLETGSVYDFANFQIDATGGNSGSVSTTSTSALLTINNGNATNESSSGYTYIYNALDSTKYTFSTVHTSGIIGDGHLKMWFGSSTMHQASYVDKFNISVSSGTFSGNLSLYGIRFS